MKHEFSCLIYVGCQCEENENVIRSDQDDGRIENENKENDRRENTSSRHCETHRNVISSGLENQRRNEE